MCVVALKPLKTDCPLRYTILAPFVRLAKRPHKLLGAVAHDPPAPYTYRHGPNNQRIYRACFVKIQGHEASPSLTVLLGHLQLDHVSWIDPSPKDRASVFFKKKVSSTDNWDFQCYWHFTKPKRAPPVWCDYEYPWRSRHVDLGMVIVGFLHLSYPISILNLS